MSCSYLVRTDPADVARVESKTFICTEKKHETVPHVKDGVKGILGQWISPEALDKELEERFPGCMKGTFIHTVSYAKDFYFVGLHFILENFKGAAIWGKNLTWPQSIPIVRSSIKINFCY